MAESNDALLGRIAVHTKLITPQQLSEATALQARTGSRARLGEVLVEKGWITPAQLEKLLAAQRQVLAKQAAKKVEQSVAAVVPEPEPGVATARPAATPSPRETQPL